LTSKVSQEKRVLFPKRDRTLEGVVKKKKHS